MISVTIKVTVLRAAMFAESGAGVVAGSVDASVLVDVDVSVDVLVDVDGSVEVLVDSVLVGVVGATVDVDSVVGGVRVVVVASVGAGVEGSKTSSNPFAK